MGSFGTAQKPRANVASRASLRRATIAWMGEPAQSEVKRPCRFDNNGPRPLSMYNLGRATPRVTCAFGRGLCWRSRTSRRIASLTHSWSHRPTPLLPRFPILSSLNSSTEQIANSLNRRARFTKYLTTILRLSYDNAKVTIDLRQTSNLQNILRRAQGFS